MTSVQRKTALIIIKKYNLGAKKDDQGIQTEKEEDILTKEFEIERLGFKARIQELKDVILN